MFDLSTGYMVCAQNATIYSNHKIMKMKAFSSAHSSGACSPHAFPNAKAMQKSRTVITKRRLPFTEIGLGSINIITASVPGTVV